MEFLETTQALGLEEMRAATEVAAEQAIVNGVVIQSIGELALSSGDEWLC